MPQPPTIFIVEDNLINQQLIARQLESFSTDVYFYTRGEYCLEDLGLNPSLVIMDYTLEGDLNGLDTLERLRSRLPEIPVIVFSSEKGLHSKENLERYGYFDFLEKCEFSFKLLKDRIAQILRPAMPA